MPILALRGLCEVAIATIDIEDRGLRNLNKYGFSEFLENYEISFSEIQC